ncbi:hypothetical protein E1301_Tti011571 [Triplophysa tibetana]|uniref:C2 domain-containing protein n=1 Tax=Triplophysa tibetana TaxID=1572043 RepID=A0A5A9PI71_9TELE|nr:hypothetical protein E1301_Tti011571 [Triplophysa tibetana]
MAFLYDVRLAFLVMLMLAQHLELTSAGVRVTGLRAENLSGADPSGNQADAYVKVNCNGVFRSMTEHRTDTDDPQWSAEFIIKNCEVGDTLALEVWDKDLIFDDHLYTCIIELKSGSYRITCPNKYYGTLYFDYIMF